MYSLKNTKCFVGDKQFISKCEGWVSDLKADDLKPTDSVLWSAVFLDKKLSFPLLSVVHPVA